MAIILYVFVGMSCIFQGETHSREAPVQHLEEQEIVVYDTTFEEDLSPFQIPSSPELDKKWDDLYNCE
jgi:hypothetical protein